jgi:hypothetical protein
MQSKWKIYSLAELNYLHSRLPTSARILISLAEEETNRSVKTPFYQSKDFTKKSIDHYWQSLLVDEKDLLSYKDLMEVNLGNKKERKEYCQKAVEQRQWDHIYYITKDISANEVISCLDPNDENHKYCNCPEAVKLVIGHWPEEVLENPNFLNPSADPYDGVALRKQLRGAIKKYAK